MLAQVPSAPAEIQEGGGGGGRREGEMTFLQTEFLKTEVKQGLEIEFLFHGDRSRGLPASALFDLRSHSHAVPCCLFQWWWKHCCCDPWSFKVGFGFPTWVSHGNFMGQTWLGWSQPWQTSQSSAVKEPANKTCTLFFCWIPQFYLANTTLEQAITLHTEIIYQGSERPQPKYKALTELSDCLWKGPTGG